MPRKILLIVLMFLVCFANATERNAVKVTLSEITKQNSKHLILNNKLKVYLISNPDSDVSSASLSMKLGQGDAPVNYAGLPHVLEHALFLGTKDYPQTEQWSTFFRPKGWSNGSTRSDVSRYHFQIDSEYFQEGVKRLYSLLFNPLLTDNGFKKALQEVEKEYHEKNNSWRKLLSVMRENINPKHPLAIFGTGNYDSLGQYDQDMRKELLALYNKFYHPENMALVVYHYLPLNELEKQVKLAFKEAPTQVNYKRSIPPSVLLESQVGNIIQASTNSSNTSLDIRFEIPPRINNINSILPEYLNEYLAGSVGKNLTSLGLATNLSLAFQGDMYTGLADIYIELTPQGNKNPERVISLILASLKNFRHDIKRLDIQQEYCLNLKKNNITKVQEVGDWLSDISDQMIRRNSNTYTEIDYCPSNITIEDIDKFTGYLTSENIQVFHVTDKAFRANGASKYYNVPFYSKKIKLSPISLHNKKTH